MAKYYNRKFSKEENQLVSIGLTASNSYTFNKDGLPWYRRLGRFRRATGNIVLRSTIKNLKALIKELEDIS